VFDGVYCAMPSLPIRWWTLADERKLQVTALRHDLLVLMP
jgi:hypothetical protein